MPLDEASRHLTAFTVPANFQPLVKLAVKGRVNVIVCIDDILLHFETHQEHRAQPEKLFNRLNDTNLKVNLKKMQIWSIQCELLKLPAHPDGILQGNDKPKAVQESVKQFIGLCNFFRSYIRNFSQIGAPFHKLTSKEKMEKWRTSIKLFNSKQH